MPTDFTYNNGAVPATKSDLTPAPSTSLDEYLSASDVNIISGALASLRTAVLTGQYHGLVDMSASMPAASPAGGVQLVSNAGQLQASQNGGSYASLPVITGTPAVNQVAVWTAGAILKGAPHLLWDGSVFTLTLSGGSGGLVLGSGQSITFGDSTTQTTAAVSPTMTAFGSVPNSNGGTFTSGALTLQPADATRPGGVSTGAQTLAGTKTFSAAPIFSSLSTGLVHADSGGNLSSSLVTLADHATLAANSFIANNTGSAATPIAMTVAQAKTLLAYSFSDLSGSVAAAQLPNPSASTLGGIESYAAVSNQWINAISTSGVPSSSQPGTSNLSDFPSQTSNGGKFLTTNGTATLSWASAVTTIGALGGSIANGGSISGATLTFGTADGTNPGLVSTGAQTWAGVKTLSKGFIISSSTNEEVFRATTAGASTIRLIDSTAGTNSKTWTIDSAATSNGLEIFPVNDAINAVLSYPLTLLRSGRVLIGQTSSSTPSDDGSNSLQVLGPASVAGNITFTSSASRKLTNSGAETVIEATGGSLGQARLHVTDGASFCGFQLETSGSNNLVDLGMINASGHSFLFRQESRAANTTTGADEWEFIPYGSTVFTMPNGNATGSVLSVGANLIDCWSDFRMQPAAMATSGAQTKNGYKLKFNYSYWTGSAATLGTAGYSVRCEPTSAATGKGDLVFYDADTTEMLRLRAGTGNLVLPYTNNSGSPGATTINKISGRAAIASTASSVVVTNSLVAATSIVIVQLESTGVGIDSLAVSCASGSFTVSALSGLGVLTAVTGNTQFSFIVLS